MKKYSNDKFFIFEYSVMSIEQANYPQYLKRSQNDTKIFGVANNANIERDTDKDINKMNT